MQRLDGRSDTDASTAANGAESATEKYILGSKFEEIHLGEGRSHDGKFLKDFEEVLENLPYLGRVRLGEQVKKGLDLVRVLFKEILKYELSPAMIDQYFDVSPLEGEEVEVKATMDEVNSDKLADFLAEGTQEMKNLTTSSLSPCKAALLVLAAYNWVPSSNKNAASIDRAKLVYKMFHGVRVDIGVMVYNQKDPRLGEEYLKNQKEEREAEKKAQRQAKKKGKSASTSTASPPSGPPPSTPRTERTDPSGYVPPRQSSRSGGKFQIIHLGSIAALEQPIDAEEAKLALDTASAAIQQLATAMQTLMSDVGQIASMLYPRGEEDADDPQQQDDQKN
ncbi:hypothetical protein F2Q70_00005159 [Brassica cretica]|uniref:Uncharacterized protein n=1 Tax=Brassica cretica TaxID=69181 RepID=A0A8S9IXY0_BRACR|nr:hypothetical protein F2Q70_00005159 [Brassica cretica]